MIFGLFRISGHSMLPKLKPDDRVIVSSIPYLFSKPQVGDVIVFKYNSSNMVKRIAKIESEKYIVSGDNKNDSLKIEPIELADILGKVIF